MAGNFNLVSIRDAHRLGNAPAIERHAIPAAEVHEPITGRPMRVNQRVAARDPRIIKHQRVFRQAADCATARKFHAAVVSGLQPDSHLALQDNVLDFFFNK
jgi:hypothetical protein